MRHIREVLRESALLFGALPLSSACNVSCAFCSNHQNPPGVETYHIAPRPLREVVDDIPLLRSHTRVVIGESATRISEGEPFLYEPLLQVLSSIRKAVAGATISITTNGTRVSARHFDVMKDLEPIELTVSLNAYCPEARRRVMSDRDPERAVQTVRMLSMSGIGFHGSLVAVPSVCGWQDFRDAVWFLADEGARTVRVFLPGYTQLATPLLTANEHERLKDEVLTLGQKTGVPITLEPAPLTNLTPEVSGVIRGLPAAAAGVRASDIVMAVDGRVAHTSLDAFQSIADATSPEIEIDRGGERLVLRIIKPHGASSGLVMMRDVDQKRLSKVLGLIRDAQRPILVSSVLAQHMWHSVMHKEALSGKCKVVAAHNSFFGGNIQCSGLLTVKDFRLAIDMAVSELARAPDLVLLPREPFDSEGRDIIGVHYDTLSGLDVRVV